MSLNFPDFLTSPARLLAADGTITPLGLRALPPGLPVIVLARELCGFARFRAPSGLSRAARLRAARLQAAVLSPYPDTGSILTRAGADFGIWWWNAAWVSERLGPFLSSARLLPEAMARPAGDGWRILKASSGFEAQFWQDGFLVGDVWSRKSFDAQEWRFVIHAFGGVDTAPDEAPPAQELPMTLDSPYLRMQVSDISLERVAPSLGAAFVTLVLCMSGYWMGEGLRLRGETARLERQAGRYGSSSQAERQYLSGELSQLRAISAAVARPDPLAVLLEAERRLQPFGVAIAGFNATGDKLRLTLSNEAGAGVDLISDHLQASGDFYDFRPRRDAAKEEVILDMGVSPTAGRVIPPAVAPPKTAKPAPGAPSSTGPHEVASPVSGLQVSGHPPQVHQVNGAR